MGWFPLAIGWWVLIALVFISLSFLACYLFKRYQKNYAKKEALQLLKKYQMAYAQNADNILIAQQLMELIRRISLFYYPRAKVAGLTGQQFIDFLNQTSENIDFSPYKELLVSLPYQATIQNAIDLTPLIEAIEKWIKQRGKAHV